MSARKASYAVLVPREGQPTPRLYQAYEDRETAANVARRLREVGCNAVVRRLRAQDVAQIGPGA